jgi:hypothetical protein
MKKKIPVGKVNLEVLIQKMCLLNETSRLNQLKNLLPYKLSRQNKDYYEYIPSNAGHLIPLFNEILINIPNIRNLSFLDIGAGNDLIPNLALIFGFKEACGLEYNDLYCNLTSNLIKGDLLEYNFHKWDVMYSYNPIGNSLLMIDGLKNIMNTMKSNSVLYFSPASGEVERFLTRNNFINVNKYGAPLMKYTKP